MSDLCGSAGPPPTLWLGVFSAPLYAWIPLILGIVAWVTTLRRDGRDLMPGSGRRFMIALSALACAFGFGGAFLGIVLAHGFDLAYTNWYDPNLARLQANHCSTTALDAALMRLNLDANYLIGGSMAFIALSVGIMLVRTRLRRRYV